MQRLKADAIVEDVRIRNRYLGSEPLWSRRAKKVPAKAVRIAWKAVTGCYW